MCTTICTARSAEPDSPSEFLHSLLLSGIVFSHSTGAFPRIPSGTCFPS